MILPSGVREVITLGERRVLCVWNKNDVIEDEVI